MSSKGFTARVTNLCLLTLPLVLAVGAPLSAQPNLIAIADGGSGSGPTLRTQVTLDLDDNRCFFPITNTISRQDFADYLTRHVEQRFVLGLGSQGYAVNPPKGDVSSERVDVALSVTCFVYEHNEQMAFSFIPIINRLTTKGSGSDQAVEITPIELDPLLGFYDGADRKAMRDNFFADLDRMVDRVSQFLTSKQESKADAKATTGQ